MQVPLVSIPEGQAGHIDSNGEYLEQVDVQYQHFLPHLFVGDDGRKDPEYQKRMLALLDDEVLVVKLIEGVVGLVEDDGDDEDEVLREHAETVVLLGLLGGLDEVLDVEAQQVQTARQDQQEEYPLVVVLAVLQVVAQEEQQELDQNSHGVGLAGQQVKDQHEAAEEQVQDEVGEEGPEPRRLFEFKLH